MSVRTKRIAHLSILTALGVGVLFLVGIIPSGRLGLMLIASFPVCITLMMYGKGWAAAVFFATAVLGFFLFPSNAGIAGYAVFFGYYPILKSLFECIHSKWLPWVLKLLLYVAAFVVLYSVLSWTLLSGTEMIPWYVLMLVGAVAFVLYDLCYSLVIRFYLDKLARYIS